MFKLELRNSSTHLGGLIHPRSDVNTPQQFKHIQEQFKKLSAYINEKEISVHSKCTRGKLCPTQAFSRNVVVHRQKMTIRKKVSGGLLLNVLQK